MRLPVLRRTSSSSNSCRTEGWNGRSEEQYRTKNKCKHYAMKDWMLKQWNTEAMKDWMLKQWKTEAMKYWIRLLFFFTPTNVVEIAGWRKTPKSSSSWVSGNVAPLSRHSLIGTLPAENETCQTPIPHNPHQNIIPGSLPRGEGYRYAYITDLGLES